MQVSLARAFGAVVMLFASATALVQAAEPLPRVLLKTTKGDVVVELYEDEAPNTVANFINLVEKKFYDGTKFHRVIDGFMAQGGDPEGTGRGGPGYTIPCECNKSNAHRHERGSLSMAHKGRDTGGSQFFITFRATPHLDSVHTVFGKVIQGMDVVDKFERSDNPYVEPDKIIEARVLQKRNHPYEPHKIAER
ncbi:MAG TPA: peptidylprolyl isomerase [Pirellulales bacterium]|jgi:cyclophilin family peptidyl-prolyl cis-trans isomerase|nr:peptidylprolyl isomerase [Pirellulales bacterium]